MQIKVYIIFSDISRLKSIKYVIIKLYIKISLTIHIVAQSSVSVSIFVLKNNSINIQIENFVSTQIAKVL